LKGWPESLKTGGVVRVRKEREVKKSRGDLREHTRRHENGKKGSFSGNDRWRRSDNLPRIKIGNGEDFRQDAKALKDLGKKKLRERGA